MIVLLVALFCLFALITIRDVRYRLVYGEDLLILVSLRILAAALSLHPNESSLPVHQWGFGSLGVSALVAGFAAASFWMLGQLVSKLSHSAALGGGDVLLLAACCLFSERARSLIALTSCLLLYLVLFLPWLGCCIKKSKTFPFAPALVWPCWLLMVL
ncbi:MAG: prepilin peptidase [Eggerthellaceae bacterium]